MDTSNILTQPELAPYREQLLATAKPSVEMKLSPAKNLPLWQSKVGGNPYFPLEMEYPMTNDGRPLSLLIQINFEEMPHLEGYPTKGILQFFIDGQGDYMGADLYNKQNKDGFRVVYHADIVKDNGALHQKFPEINPKDFYAPFEFGDEFSISFTKKEQLISTEDFSFGDIIPDYFDLGKVTNVIYDSELYSSGHRIGGYPYFTQGDPREYKTVLKNYELLLQLDSDDYIMWGDSGVGNFFIHPEDLKALDFSKVAYTWDCC